MVFQGEEYLNTTCCGGNCQISANSADVYYWPDPPADTSCSSIVSEGVSYVADGATTAADGSVYWACTVWGTSLGIMADQSSTIVRTATLADVAGISYKEYLVNPWDPSQCGNASTTLSFQQSSTIPTHGLPASLRPRGHSLLITNSGVSTTVSGNHTFTSPSVYVNFQGLHAADGCGSTYIPSTMIAFAPGELSTIKGQIGLKFATPQAFNPKDLPCPPYSVMSQNWYTPLPGVPYRPYFAFPDKLRQISDFKYCNAFFFSVFDPPRTLGSATAMVPNITTVDVISTSTAPMPSPTVYQPAQITTSPRSPPQVTIEKPAQTGKAEVPGSPDPPAGDNNGSPNGGSNDSSLVPRNDPAKVPHQDPAANSPVADPSAANQDPSNPNDESAAQMSALYQALKPAPPAGPQAQPIPSPPGANQPGVAISGAVVSLGSYGDLVITATAGAAPVQPAIITAGTRAYKALNADLAIAGATVAPGGSAVLVAGTPVSLGASGTLVLGSTTTPLTESLPPSIFTVGGQAFTANPTAFPVAGKTLSAGGPAVLLSGTPVSLDSQGKLVIGSTTVDLAHPTQSYIFKVGGQSFTANPTGFAMAGTTSSARGPGMIISGTSISLDPSGALINGKTTILLGDPLHSIITTDGQTPTIEADGQVAVGDATLTNGGSASTVDGVPISVSPGVLVIGTDTVSFDPSSPTTSVITADGQVLTVAGGRLVAINDVTLTSGGPGITISGIPMRLC